MPAKQTEPTRPPLTAERILRTREVQALYSWRITNRMLQWWDERNFLKPAPRHFGHTRWYTGDDALIAGIVEALRGRRVSLQQIRRVIKAIERNIRGKSFQVARYALIDHRRRQVHFMPDSESAMAVLCQSKGEPVIIDVHAILTRIQRRWSQLA